MNNNLFRVEPIPSKEGGEKAIVATSNDGEHWTPIPIAFPDRGTAEKYIDMAIEGFKMIEDYQKKNPPYLYPRKMLN